MGFETVVRPVVFPNIRPAPPRVLPAENDPLQGMVSLKGGGVVTFNGSYSFSFSVSRQQQKELKRLVDVDRVYQADASGNINRNNYIDVERAKASKFEEGDPIVKEGDPGSGTVRYDYVQPKEQPANVETLETDKVITSE